MKEKLLRGVLFLLSNVSGDEFNSGIGNSLRL